MYQDRIYEDHLDLFDQEGLELINIAAIVLGREMGKIARRDEGLFNRIAAVLSTNSLDLNNSSMAMIMREHFDNTVEENFLLIKQILAGFLNLARST
jgi:2C-methyl-D-erythritol 2,4-cyclodiphosphate synthase